VSATLITERIWPTLTTAARQSRSPGAVAVAYFGQGAAKLLPLQRGNRLVVDASDGAVKSGQTCPTELKRLASKGVRIYTIQNLHAKAFVFGTRAFIGSANVSHHSAGTLVEAMLATTDRKAVTAARDFIRGLCVQELGPEAIERLARIYHPPRIAGAHGPRTATNKRAVRVELPRVRLVQLILREPPEGSEDVEKAGRKIASKRREKRKGHFLDDFWLRGKCLLSPGDIVVQVLNEGRGRNMVSPPATVIHTRRWRRGSRTATFVYVEVPGCRRVTLERLAERLGRNAGKRLRRGGWVRRDFSERLLAAWSQ